VCLVRVKFCCMWINVTDIFCSLHLAFAEADHCC